MNWEGKQKKAVIEKEAEDYRFIKEPDLPGMILEEKFIKKLELELPESPEKKLEKFVKKHRIDKKNAEILSKHIDIAEFFEKIAEKIDVKFALPWITIELLRHLNYNKKSLDELDIKTEHFIELLEMIKNGKITALQGKEILDKFYPKSFSPTKAENKITDKEELEKIIKQVIKDNKKAVGDYKAGESTAINFLIGEIMKKTNKRADFNIAREVLKKLLVENAKV